MPRYSENGLTLEWRLPATAAPGAPLRLPVTVRPAHPANVVRAFCSFDGGAEREVRGFRTGAAEPDGAEVFVVELPAGRPGATLAVVPVASCSGRSADPRRGGPAPEAVAFGAPPPAEPPEPPAAFRLGTELLGRVTVPLERGPQAMGETPDGLHVAFPLGEGGAVRGPRLNGSILHSGGDWMLVRRDGIGLSEVRVLIRERSGALIMGEYGGVVDFGRDGYAALLAGRGPARAPVQLVPRYLTSSEPLAWLNRLQCLGIGRVTLTTLVVEYDLYAVRSEGAGEAVEHVR